jgi:Domain of unknown function (DUF4389)
VTEDRLRVVTREPLRRRRLAVLFRAVLVLPHYVVLVVWTLLAAPVLVFGWIAALLRGRLPGRVHRFLAAYLRYAGQVTAWYELLSGRYPRLRRTGEHPFAIEVPVPERQRRLVTLLRIPLAVPAAVLASVFGVILGTSAVGAWFVALVLGRTTAGLAELGTFCLRYQLETSAYLLLLTPRYPRLEPAPPPAEQLLIPGLD